MCGSCLPARRAPEQGHGSPPRLELHRQGHRPLPQSRTIPLKVGPSLPFLSSPSPPLAPHPVSRGAGPDLWSLQIPSEPSPTRQGLGPPIPIKLSPRKLAAPGGAERHSLRFSGSCSKKRDIMEPQGGRALRSHGQVCFL